MLSKENVLKGHIRLFMTKFEQGVAFK